MAKTLSRKSPKPVIEQPAPKEYPQRIHRMRDQIEKIEDKIFAIEEKREKLIAEMYEQIEDLYLKRDEIIEQIDRETGCDCFALNIKCTGHD